MLFDFKETYKDYTNVALLQIILQPERYQPEAVSAANLLLESRTVTEEERQKAAYLLQESASASAQKKQQQEAFKHKAIDILEPLLRPGSEVNPQKWLNILLITLILQYLWSIYNASQTILYFVSNDPESLPWELLHYFDLIWTPVIIYLIYRRKKWGWILLFGDSLFVVISSIYQTSALVAYLRSNPDGEFLSFFLTLFLHAAFCFFLWRKDIADHFSVKDRLKKKTGIIVAVLSLLLLAAITIAIPFL